MTSMFQNQNYMNTNTTSKLILGMAVLCSCMGTMIPPNPWQDFVALPLNAIQSYYCCVACLLILGMTVVGKQPIVGRSAPAAFMLACCIGCITGPLMRSGFTSGYRTRDSTKKC